MNCNRNYIKNFSLVYSKDYRQTLKVIIYLPLSAARVLNVYKLDGNRNGIINTSTSISPIQYQYYHYFNIFEMYINIYKKYEYRIYLKDLRERRYIYIYIII